VVGRRLLKQPSLPGGELVEKGLSDLAEGMETVESLLVSIVSPRLSGSAAEGSTADASSTADLRSDSASSARAGAPIAVGEELGATVEKLGPSRG
jgi:hypothetical protein